jgi:hypothetical protein
MESHRLFFDQKLNEYTAHPIFHQPIEHGLHITCHEMVRPPMALSKALGELVIANLVNLPSSSLDEPVDRIHGLEDTIKYLDQISNADTYVAREADELARNLTFQYRFIAR